MLWLFKAAKARFDPGEDPWSEQAKRRRQSRARLLAETNKKNQAFYRDGLNKRHAAVASDYVSKRCISYKSSPILDGTLQTAAYNRGTKMKDDLKDLISEKLTGDETFTDHWELYEHLDYDGSVHELIDSNIDIYYRPLRQWAVDNWAYVEDAISEGLAEDVTDYHKLIQLGQYVQLSEEAREAVEELYTELDGELFNVEVTA